MKNNECPSIPSIQDFLQDVQSFLDQTLSSEKLSRTALEQKSRLTTKLNALMKEYENYQMEMYIDMSPVLKSFFHSPDSSISDNSSTREPASLLGNTSDELYDIPTSEPFFKPTEDKQESKDECDTAPALPPLQEEKKKGFIHRLLKSRSKLSDSSYALAKKASTDSEDDRSRRENEESEIYDDATAVKTSRTDNNSPDCVKTAFNNLTQNEPSEDGIIYDDTSVTKQKVDENNSVNNNNKNPPNEEIVYEDACSMAETCEEYEYVKIADPSAQKSQNDISEHDDVSLKSGTSDYAMNISSHRWHISVSEVKPQALRYGYMKRRNGRKMLSTWRNCYSVLLPGHLLMYVNEGDSQPRTVIDLGEPNIKVKRMVKQGVDPKRLKTHPFVLLHEERPLYELSTKSRDETENWIVALQAVLDEVVETDKMDEYNEVYEQPQVNHHQMDLQGRLECIQARNLPSLPAEPSQQKPQLPLPNRLPAPIQFEKSQSSSSEESIKRQSVDSSTNTDDELYQVLPSPAASTTPYSSVENLKPSDEEIYNSIEDNKCSTSENINSTYLNERRPPSQLEWPGPPSEEVYDIPSPTVRPLNTKNSNGSATTENNSFSTIALQRKETFSQQLQKAFRTSTTVSNTRGVYDIPPSNPRPVLSAKDKKLFKIEPKEQIEVSTEYDCVSNPPRSITSSIPIHPTTSKSTTNLQEKKNLYQLKPLSTFKKDPPTKCLPKPSTEIKSVGRCFSRVSPQRIPLTSLTEIITSSKIGTELKPSSIKKEVSSVDGKVITPPVVKVSSQQTKFLNSLLESRVITKSDIVDTAKKVPPTRPPPPVRTFKERKIVESNVAMDELSQHLMKRALKIKETENLTTEIKSEDSLENSNKGATKERYRARLAYIASNIMEVSVNKDEIVQVLTKTEVNWLVQARNKKGLIPKEYLVPVSTS